MEKQLALMFLLLIQPIFAGLIWFSINILVVQLGMKGIEKTGVVVIISTIPWVIFTFFFARGFLASKEAKKLGF